jgi:hypothetical protein
VVCERPLLAIAARRAAPATAGEPRAGKPRAGTPLARARRSEIRRQGPTREKVSAARAPKGQDPMIAHLVLFKPRKDLSAADRNEFGDAIQRARSDIPGIRRFSIGRRVLKEAGYAQAMPEDFSYAAIVEFDDLAALQAYLIHPVHEPLGALFWKTSEATLVYDYELTDASNVSELLG